MIRLSPILRDGWSSLFAYFMLSAMNQITTATFPASSRLAYWQDVVCRMYADVECIPLSGAFEASVGICDLGTVQLSDVGSSPVDYIRTAESIRRAPGDHFQLCLLQSGRATIAQSGREARLGPGDLALFDAARPYALRFDDTYRSLHLNLPRHLLSSRVSDVESLTAHRLSGVSRLGAFVASMLREAETLPDLAPTLAARLGSAIVDIVGAAIEGELREHISSHAKQRSAAERIKQFLDENLEDSTLNIEAISVACHVAPRTIHRAFAAEGTTAIRWLWQRRLEMSYRLLEERQVSQVSEVAIRCGFSDFSHFARAFRRSYGVAPNRVLRGDPD
ncbi:helix-turn-helix domain-containing protein [Paraburkholderia tropica]|uniref:AraC-like ligand-binding domain-containing protein n=1 Tax=Paraburkholderia tropica TaxID=92647 RepID=UPI00158FDF49|nr:helix-turn-helix domain-containing protein [Paraburkholderia tropica]